MINLFPFDDTLEKRFREKGDLFLMAFSFGGPSSSPVCPFHVSALLPSFQPALILSLLRRFPPSPS